MIEHVGILLTPRAVADGIADAIIADLVDMTKMHVLWLKYWHIDSEYTFDLIYPNLVNKPFKGTMVKNLTSGQSLIVLAKGENLFSILKEVKGKFKYHPDGRLKISGLRLKYQPSFIDNSGNDDGWFDFRFHTTDTTQETITIITLSANYKEMAVIEKIAPELFKSGDQTK